MAMQARRHHPARYHFFVAGALALGGAALLWWGLSGRADWRHLLGCWLVAANVVTFGYYGYDKSQAQNGGPRVPELVLHGLTALGGSAGAYAGMQLFRHKTVKGMFRLLFWLIVALQVALIAWVVKLTWWG